MSLERMDDLFGVTELMKKLDDEEHHADYPSYEKGGSDTVNKENVEIREMK